MTAKKDDKTKARERIVAILTRFPVADATIIARHIRPYIKGWQAVLQELLLQGTVEAIVSRTTPRTTFAYRLKQQHGPECLENHRCTQLCIHQCDHSGAPPLAQAV